MGARYLVRLDDACPTMQSEAWELLEVAFDKLGIKPIAGVIPENRDPSLFLNEVDAGFWECPELFELAVDGDDKNKKWVMYGVTGTYLIGSFDGKKFVPETEMLRYNADGMTAAQTFNDEPNGRRLQIGWARAQFPDSPFRHTFTFVQEYKLKTTRNGVRLFINPIKEIKIPIIFFNGGFSFK